jgi:predicted XRE-type DNA-binding protein
MPDFPSDEELKQIRKLMRKAKGSRPLPIGASIIDKAKHETCAQILSYMQKHELSQRELGEILGAPESRVSEIIRYHHKKYTLDRLISYLQILNPKIKIKVA